MFSFPAYSQHMENHINPPSYLSQPLPPVHSGRYSPTPKTVVGDDDVTRYGSPVLQRYYLIGLIFFDRQNVFSFSSSSCLSAPFSFFILGLHKAAEISDDKCTGAYPWWKQLSIWYSSGYLSFFIFHLLLKVFIVSHCCRWLNAVNVR